MEQIDGKTTATRLYFYPTLSTFLFYIEENLGGKKTAFPQDLDNQ